MARGKVILIAGVIVVGALWTGVWYGGQHLAAGVLDDTARAAVAGRPGADCRGRSIVGFPLNFGLACDGVTVIGRAGVKAETGGISVSAPLYKPGRVNTSVRGPVKLEAARQGIAAEARFTTASSTADFWLDGASRIAGNVEKLNLAFTGRAVLPFKSVALTRGNAELVGSTRMPDSLDVNIDAAELDLLRVNGKPLPRLDLKARATLVGSGGTLRPDGDAQMAAWLRSGGRLSVSEVIVSAEQSAIEAAGDLMVAPNGLLSGKLRLRIVGLAGIPELMEATIPGTRDRAKQAVTVVAAMTRLVDTGRGPAQEVDVQVANGVVMVGIIPIAMIPPVF